MGDTSLAADILSAVSEVMADDVGKSITVRHFTLGALDPSNPGAGQPQTPVNEVTNGIISAYDAKRIDGTNILKGDMECVLSVDELTTPIEPGFRLIDGSVDYEIIRVELPEVAGISVVAILQLRK